MKQGWKTCKFADVFDLQMGKTPSRDNPTYWGDDNMWVSIADMNEQKYMSATKEGITDIAVQESGIKPIPKGTVIMSFKLSIGKVSIATSKLYTNEAIMGFIEKEEGTLVPEYLYYYLKGYKWEGANKAAMGMTLNKKTIAENTISYPPVAEQEKIVAELDCLSGIIEKKKQQLKELDNLAQSIFYDMFGDPVENDKGWERLLFEKCIEKVRYTAKIATCNYATTGTFPIISQEEDYISGYWNNAEDVFMISKPVVIFGDHTRVLKYVDFDFVLGADGVKILQPIDTINAKFFLYYLIASKIPSLGYSRHYKLLKELKVLLPPLSLQQDFASKIESIEKQKELIANSIKETETLFNSRMDDYFN